MNVWVGIWHNFGNCVCSDAETKCVGAQLLNTLLITPRCACAMEAYGSCSVSLCVCYRGGGSVRQLQILVSRYRAVFQRFNRALFFI